MYTLLLLIACLTAGTSAQAQTITYRKKNASLNDILKVIKKQAEYGHIFKGEIAERAKRVDINVKNATVKEYDGFHSIQGTIANGYLYVERKSD
jgi:hypothetical protein